jgi:amino acid transporter
LIPRATIGVLFIAGFFWMFSGFALALSEPQHTMVAYLNSPSQTGAVYLVANQYIGAGKVMIIITGFTAIFAAYSGATLASGRILFAMARDGRMPRLLAKVDKEGTPRTAQLISLGASLLIGVVVALWQDRSVSSGVAWAGEAFVFFVMIAYGLANVANLFFHLRTREYRFNWLLNGVVPILGIAVCGWVIYEGFFKVELGQPFKTGSSIVIFSCAYAVLVAVLVIARGRRRDRVAVAVPQGEQ